ncbi:hypothetical protein [Tenacibaculum finnmarkense]|uniref:hypothetical protein n=1 Tax=Tenacibaculum finnmarkense TaxID=2781243 RepID=UPI001E501425|nr:hypothetical protein [Tenacibaculum finnmarkense]MCD8423649.1 hypothetical protein [Tenacibaculum finnmarkense genomovar ulcerans]MCG8239798.1 hypothetical protein [Tenacibaculum finnmarkense genomovar ulcerans]
MEYIKILDELLKYMTETNHDKFNQIRHDVNDKSDFLKDVDNPTLHSALLKLVKDGYVNRESEDSIDPLFKTPRTDYFYKISFEGLVFIKNGGYHNYYEKTRMKENELSDLKSQQSRHSTHLVFLTWLIALGTLIAGVYYILEILKTLGVCIC